MYAGFVEKDYTLPVGHGWRTDLYPLPKVWRAAGGGQILTNVNPWSYLPTSLAGATNFLYVSPTGSDSNNGTSTATPLASMNKAIVLANTAAVPTIVYIKPGNYGQSQGFAPTGTSLGSLYPIAFICSAVVFGVTGSSRAMIGTFQTTQSWTINGTYSNVSQIPISNTARVFDMLNLDENGDFTEINWAQSSGSVATLSAAAFPTATLPDGRTVAAAGNWWGDGTNTYIVRKDGLACTTANTLVLRTYVNFQSMGRTGPLLPSHVYMENLDLVGGEFGVFDGNSQGSGFPVTRNVVGVNCSFKYGGFYGTGAAANVCNATSTDYTAGLHLFVNCVSAKCSSDCFNIHCSNASYQGHLLTINCTGRYGGFLWYNGAVNSGVQSCNGFTGHGNAGTTGPNNSQGAMAIDIGGYYMNSFGRDVAFIDNSNCWCVGTRSFNSYGDANAAGSQEPSQFWAANNHLMWLEDTFGQNSNSNSNGSGNVVNSQANAGFGIRVRNAQYSGSIVATTPLVGF